MYHAFVFIQAYNNTHSATIQRIKAIQQRLESDDLTQEEISALTAELQELQSQVGEWDGKQQELEQLLAGADTVIKDRGSQRRLHFASEIQALAGTMGRTASLLEQKQGKLNKLSDLWGQFENKQNGLTTLLTTTQTHLNQQKLQQSSLGGIQHLSDEVKTLQHQLDANTPQLNEFQDLARQLIATDPVKANKAQQHLQRVEDQWDHVHDLLGEKFAQCSKVNFSLVYVNSNN